MRGCTANIAWLPISLYLVIKSSNQLSADSWNLKVKVLFAWPGFHQLCASCSRNTCTAAYNMAKVRGWVTPTMVCKSWNWMKLTAIHCPNLPPNLRAFNRLQSSTIITSVSTSALCRGGEMDSWCFLLCHVSRILVFCSHRFLCEQFFVPLG